MGFFSIGSTQMLWLAGFIIVMKWDQILTTDQGNTLRCTPVPTPSRHRGIIQQNVGPANPGALIPAIEYSPIAHLEGSMSVRAAVVAVNEICGLWTQVRLPTEVVYILHMKKIQGTDVSYIEINCIKCKNACIPSTSNAKKLATH